MMIAQELKSSGSDTHRRLIAALILVPVAIYSWAFLRYSIDMPAGDDYDAILDWLHRFIGSQGLPDKLHLLLESHNEHRIIFDRLAVLANYLLLGRINFIYLDAIGATGLLLIFALLIKLARNLQLSGFQLVPIAFLTLNLRQWELLSFPMASIQQYWQFFFALAALCSLQKRNDRPSLFFVAIGLATLASFSGGGGLIVFPVGLLLLAHARDWRYAGIWFGTFALIFLLYFGVLEYHGSAISHDSHQLALKHPGLSLRYFLAFLGGYVRSSNLAIALGAITFALCALLTLREIRSKATPSSLIPLSFILYIVAVAAAAGLSRASMGIDEALSSRYTIYPLTLAVAIYIHLVSKITPSTQRTILFGTTFLTSLILYFCYLSSSIAFLNYEQTLLSRYMVYPYNGRAEGILADAMKDGIFMPNAVVFSNLSEKTKAGIIYKYPVPYSLDNSIPLPRTLVSIIHTKPGYSESWDRLSKLYFSHMDLKLAFPLNNNSSYVEFLSWAANADYIDGSDRVMYRELATLLSKAQPDS